MSFKYNFDDRVKLKESGETGQVIGCAHIKNAEDLFLVRYKAGDGRAVENWWKDDALEAE